MDKFHLLVEWINEEKMYSVVTNNMIVDETKRQLATMGDLIGQILDIVWEDESWAGRVLDVSEKYRKLDKKCKQLSKQAQDESNILNNENDNLGKGKRLKITKDPFEPEVHIPKERNPVRYDIRNIKENLLNDVDDVEEMASCESCETQKGAIGELKRKCTSLEEGIDKYKRKYRKLAEQHCELQKKTCNPNVADKVDIGNGVMVCKATLEHRIAFYNTPTILGRKIMEIIFTVQELKNCSLNGKQSNANKGKPVLPPLDPLKVAAVIDYTSRQFPGQQEDEIKKKLRISLTSFLRELRSGKILTNSAK